MATGMLQRAEHRMRIAMRRTSGPWPARRPRRALRIRARRLDYEDQSSTDHVAVLRQPFPANLIAPYLQSRLIDCDERSTRRWSKGELALGLRGIEHNDRGHLHGVLELNLDRWRRTLQRSVGRGLGRFDRCISARAERNLGREQCKAAEHETLHEHS